jgi:hypothetical protein
MYQAHDRVQSIDSKLHQIESLMKETIHLLQQTFPTELNSHEAYQTVQEKGVSISKNSTTNVRQPLKDRDELASSAMNELKTTPLVKLPTPDTSSGRQQVDDKKQCQPLNNTLATPLPSVDIQQVFSAIQFLRQNYHGFVLPHFQQESFLFIHKLISSHCSLSSFDSLYQHHSLPNQLSVEEKRRKAKDFIKSQIRVSLKCAVFDVDSEMIGCPLTSSSSFLSSTISSSSPFSSSSSLKKLPDNSVTFYVLVGKSYAHSWQTILFDHLANLTASVLPTSNTLSSSTSFTSSGSTVPANNNDEHDAFTGCDEKDRHFSSLHANSNTHGSISLIQDLKIIQPSLFSSSLVYPSFQDISSSSSPSLYPPFISFTLDGMIPVNIYADPLLPLSFYSFVEEISEFIGKQQLLKRSYYFCKVFLEQQLASLLDSGERENRTDENKEGKKSRNPSFTTDSLPSSTHPVPSATSSPTVPFTEEVLWVMILMIFNKYPLSFIDNPLQCLLLVLMEMSYYQPSKHIVTIFGIFDATTTPPPSSGKVPSPSSAASFPPTPNHLQSQHERKLSLPAEKFSFPSAILNKHIALINPSYSVTYHHNHQSHPAAGRGNLHLRGGGVGGTGGHHQHPSGHHHQHSHSSQPSNLVGLSYSIVLPSLIASASRSPSSGTVNSFPIIVLHPLSSTVIQFPSLSSSRTFKLKTVSNNISEIFHFGIIKFLQFYELSSTFFTQFNNNSSFSSFSYQDTSGLSSSGMLSSKKLELLANLFNIDFSLINSTPTIASIASNR